MYTLDSLRAVVEKKFISNKPIDFDMPLSEIEAVKKFIDTLKDEGVTIEMMMEIPFIFYLLNYSDDDFTSRMISYTDDDVMQTARATLFSAKGDCEDIHRLYNAAAVALGVPASKVRLLVVFFGDEKKITGAHATCYIADSTNTLIDYSYLVTSPSLDGLLSYISDTYKPVYAYVSCMPDITGDVMTYSIADSGYADKRDKFNVSTCYMTAELAAVKKKIARSSENEKTSTGFITAAGALVAGIIISKLIGG